MTGISLCPSACQAQKRLKPSMISKASPSDGTTRSGKGRKSSGPTFGETADRKAE